MTRVTAKNNKSRGKQDERDVARILGGQRHPADSGGLEDVAHEWLCIQVKGGGAVTTGPLRDGLAGAQAISPPTKLACVVLVDRRGTRLKRYIAFELEQFAAWHGIPGEVVADE
jgi:hypothetical protein